MSLKKSNLREIYNIDFKKLYESLEKVLVDPEFWTKLSSKNAERMRKAKAERLSMIPSWEHTQRVYVRLKGE